jgi:hypothetical protein
LAKIKLINKNPATASIEIKHQKEIDKASWLAFPNNVSLPCQYTKSTMDKMAHENILLPRISPIAALIFFNFNKVKTVMISGILVTIPNNNE